MIQNVLEQTLLFFPVSLAIYLTYVILKTTDLTVDGSFVLGAAVFAKLLTLEFHPVICLIVAMLAGALSGIGVSLIQLQGRITPLIASILAVFILSSLNLIIMDRPNISLLRLPTLFSFIERNLSLLVTLLAAGIPITCMILLLQSRTGLILRAIGENQLLVRLMSIRSVYYKTLGLIISNSMAAFCGAMTAQSNGYADIQMGFGMALIGIGSVAIGEQLRQSIFPESRHPITRIIFCFLATLLYFFVFNSLIRCGINPLYLKMSIGFLLVACLAATSNKESSHA